MSNTLIKFAVLLLAIKEIWLLLGVPAVVNAVTSFLMMGQIPGTNHTLKPDEVIRLVIVLFVAFGVMLFRRELWRIAKLAVRRSSSQQPTATMPIPHPLTPLTVIAPDEAASQDVPASELIGYPVVHRWAWRVRAVLFLGWVKLQMVTLAIRDAIERYSRIVVVNAEVAAVGLARWGRVAALFVARQAVAAWRWAEPYLRRFDAYLERKLHEYDTTATLLSLGNEMTSTVQKWRGHVPAKQPRK